MADSEHFTIQGNHKKNTIKMNHPAVETHWSSVLPDIQIPLQF